MAGLLPFFSKKSFVFYLVHWLKSYFLNPGDYFCDVLFHDYRDVPTFDLLLRRVAGSSVEIQKRATCLEKMDSPSGRSKMISTTPAESPSVRRWKIQPTGEEQDPDQIYKAPASACNICLCTIPSSLQPWTTCNMHILDIYIYVPYYSLYIQHIFSVFNFFPNARLCAWWRAPFTSFVPSSEAASEANTPTCR